jgi:hypothetical protein
VIPSGQLAKIINQQRAIELIKVTLLNNTPSTKTIKVSFEIKDICSYSDQFEIEPGESLDERFKPSDFTDRKISAPRDYNLNVRISTLGSNGKIAKVIYDRSLGKVKVLPWNVIRWPSNSRLRKGLEDTSDYIAAFVTPEAKEICNLLVKVKKKFPGVNWLDSGSDPDIAGERAKARVKAIYDYLRNYFKINYEESAKPYLSGCEMCQKIQLPSEIIKYRRGNCVDMVVLMASLIECARCKPFFVLIPKHAILAWAAAKSDPFDSGNVINAVSAAHSSRPGIIGTSFKDARDIALNEIAGIKNHTSSTYPLIIDVVQNREKYGIVPLEP